jgi:hypothetical protein
MTVGHGGPTEQLTILPDIGPPMPKDGLRRAQQRRALDRSGPFRTTLLRRGKGLLRTAPQAGDHFAAILVPFFAAADTRRQSACHFLCGVLEPAWGPDAKKPPVASTGVHAASG